MKVNVDVKLADGIKDDSTTEQHLLGDADAR
jgi:hypothetical protein